VIADSPSKTNGSKRVVVDEILISPQGWVPVDPTSYLSAMHSPTVESADEDVLELTAADVAAARLTRSLRISRSKQMQAPSRIAVIPAHDIVPIGGVNLQPRTPEQPFADEAELANDNFGRLSLLVVLLLAVIGGYAFTTLRGDDRRAIEVTPPENAAIKIAMIDRSPL